MDQNNSILPIPNFPENINTLRSFTLDKAYQKNEAVRYHPKFKRVMGLYYGKIPDNRCRNKRMCSSS
jgi:hypothetical protein